MEGASPLQGPPAATALPTGNPTIADNLSSHITPPFTAPHHDAPGFEFGTRRSPPNEHRGAQWGTSFADELFQDGRILPLKLPPRLQNAGGSRPSSPTSPASASWRLLWRPGGAKIKGDFDPFMAALERVRKAEVAVEVAVAGEEHGFPTRRARSLSPLRANPGGGRPVAERRRAPSPPQWNQPWRARQGPRGSSTWTTASHGQVMETSSQRSWGSENSLRGGGGEGRGKENSKFFISATARCGGRRVVAKGLGKKKSSTAYWRGLVLCLGFHV